MSSIHNAVTGVSKRKRAKVAARFATVKEGVDQKRATPISKPAESEEATSTLNMPMDTANVTIPNVGSEVEFGYMTPYGLDGANYALSSSNMEAPAGPYYYHFPTEPTYAPPPFADMTATANLFPQGHHAPAFLELPPLHHTTPSMSSRFEGFAMADYNNDSIRTNNSTLTGNIDYHSSDHIFDRFNAKFGSLDSAY